MTKPLAGLSILVPESRELDLFAGMLEAEGATAVRCPLVRILPLDDTSAAEAFIEQQIAGAFDDLIWLTGEGLRHLLAIAEHQRRRMAFVDSLRGVRMVTRGPKPARVLHEMGLGPGLVATTPTSQGVIEALSREPIDGRRIGVQLYPGNGTAPLIAALRERGAIVYEVTPYRYASQAETAQVVDVIAALAARRIGMIAFTSSPQVERLVAVAREAGVAAQLGDALTQIPIAAIGPVVEDTLRRHGVTTVLRPQTSFHLKPLVRTIVAAWAARSQLD